jgi:hypothetical protein
MAHIIYNCIPDNGSVRLETHGDMKMYNWEYVTSMEEIAGIGVQIVNVRVFIETDDREPYEAIFGCWAFEECYEYPKCYIPGNHKVECEGAYRILTNRSNFQWIKLTFTLTGIDDNGNIIEATTNYTGSGIPDLVYY